MIKMADLLRAEYRTCRTIYLSWDAAAWHISKKLFSHLDEMNQQAIQNGFPIVNTAPLPAGAPFLNVIESVFSGMAKGGLTFRAARARRAVAPQAPTVYL